MAALESIEAAAGTTKSLPDARLVRGGMIVGRVIDADTGRPLRPVSSGPSPSPLYIRMYGPSCPRNSGVCNTAQFQEDGSFQLRAAPGANYVNLEHIGHPLPGVNTYVGGDDGWEDVSDTGLTVDVVEGQTTKIEFKVRKKAVENTETSTSQEERQPTTKSSRSAAVAPAKASDSSGKTSAAKPADDASNDKPADNNKPHSPPPAAVKPDESPRPKNESSGAIVDPQLKLVKQATTDAWKQLVSGEGKGTCRRTLTDKQDEKFDFEFAFDGDKFRFVTSEGAGTHYMAVCDGSATLVRDYYVKLDSGSQVAFLKPPEFVSLSPMVSSYGRLYLPFLPLPTGPRGILGKVFETRASTR